MDDVIARLGELVGVLASRLLILGEAILIFVGIYLVVTFAVRRLGRRAARMPVPGGRDGMPEDQAIREAVRRRRIDTLVLAETRLAKAVLFALIAVATITTLAPEVVSGLGALGVALGAALGAALGFGAQQLVRDYLNGALILGENPFSVGDVVALAGIRGTVEEVGLRRTIVRDNDGVVHSVPNGEILVASNFTRTFARVNERFTVAPGTDIARATSVLGEVCVALVDAEGWSGRFIEAPRVVRVDAAAAGDPGIPILVSATVRPGEQWEVAGELRRRAMDALRVAGIDLAAGRTLVVARGPLPAAEPAADPEGDADFT